jgi:hydroxymethylglutaryl-CoA reductase
LIDSRLSGFYKLGLNDRIAALQRQGWLSPDDARRLREGRQVLSVAAADKIIENVVGVFGLPFAIAPNFLVNERDRMVPLVVEEPSIVAALSSAARAARNSGGFHARCDESLLAGQIHVTGMADVDAAAESLEANREQLVGSANAVHPRLVGRGGGVTDLEIRRLRLPGGAPLLAVHLLVDTVDAMGANLVNTMCEALAEDVADLCNGEVALRILSNLCDRSVVTATARFDVADLGRGSHDGARVRDAIVMANDIARVDPYRAATHNKGIMNGVDALAIATGNDWRAIEAGAHAFAAQNGRYGPLTRWFVDGQGDLVGEIAIPLKVGTVGGTLDANPAARLGLAISGVESARALAELMAAVGLAQNFAALRALASTGIQEGHMRLHARSVAAAAGAAGEQFDEVVSRLIESGEIKDWKAREIIGRTNSKAVNAREPLATAAGKVILLGEHAAVYGRHALALPIVNAVKVFAGFSEGPTRVDIPRWGISALAGAGGDGIDAAIALIVKKLGVADREFSIQVDSELPAGMGLGSSAAIAVGITRALSELNSIHLDNEQINAIAFECEKLAHGAPSGVDNTLSTFAQPMLFRNDGELHMQKLSLASPPPLVIGWGDEVGRTHEQVAGVRARRERAPERYNALFDEIDSLSISGARLLQAQEYDELGLLMNICHGLLNAIEVSTPTLEEMVRIARQSGAVGAKLTGGGGGGSIVALCPDSIDAVQSALRQAGYRTMVLQ